MGTWSQEIKELKILIESFKTHLPDLEKELARLIKSDDEKLFSITRAGALRVIITDLCECELKRPPENQPLKGIIDKLNKEREGSSTYNRFDAQPEQLSTFGAHPKDLIPKGKAGFEQSCNHPQMVSEV